jgi:hypothetical protein
MMRSRRRDSVVMAAIVAISGCTVLGTTHDRAGTTHVHSAELETVTPMLPAFVVRIAIVDVSLDPEQTALATSLARDCDRYARPIDDARAVFIEELLRAVRTQHFAAPNAPRAAKAVVAAAAEAAPKLDAALAKLHAALDPWQRRQLATRVRSRFHDWSAEWNGGVVDDHAWLASIGTDHFASSTEDARATTRRWTDGLIAEVHAAESLDDAGRDALIARLRAARL